MKLEPRLMTEIVPGGKMVITDAELNPSYTNGWGNYEIQETQAGGAASAMYDFVSFGYFDLSGYTLRELTTYIQDVSLQRIGTYGLDQLETLVNVTETVIVSTTPLTMEDMTIDLTLWNAPNPGAMKPYPPGTMVSAHTLQEIVAGEQRGFTLDVGAALGRIDQNTRWGAGSSTAGEKLYYARAFRFPRVQNDGFVPTPANYGFQAPDLAISIPILVGKEDELPYMMRLQRSIVRADETGQPLGI